MSRVAPSSFKPQIEVGEHKDRKFYGHDWFAEHFVRDMEESADELRREADFLDGKSALLREQMMLAGWQPIDTAPPYRVPVLLIARYPTGHGWTGIYYGWRNAGGANWERWPHDFRPTHWMHPPAPPSEERP
jgi:hypothetical protein